MRPVNITSISVLSEYLTKYVRRKLCRRYDYYIAQVTEKFGAAKLLGRDA